MTYPTISPKLTLDFANSRQLDPRITFTRTSTATYLHPDTGLITTASDGVARFEKEGLLVEESRTNLFPISETYASWNVDNNATVATDGTTIAGLTAVKLTSNVDTNALFLEGNNATFTASTTYTASVYHKPGNVDGFWFEIRQYTGGGTPKVYFDSTTETWSADSGTFNGQPWSVKSQKVESNAWRHSITFYIATDTAGTARIGGLGPVNSTNVSTGDYGYIAAPQLEASAFPTSYIPTAGATVTRASDVASITGTNFSSWYSQGEGSLFLHLSGQTYTTADYKRLVTIANSSSDSMSADDQISFGSHAGITSQRWLTRNGSNIAYIPLALNPPVTKTAIGFKSPDASSATYDGADIVTYTITDAIPTAVDRLNLYGTQRISRLSYYDRRLTDAQLQALTL